MGEPGAGFLFGGDGVEGGLQVTPYRRHRVLPVEERDRVLELAAEVAQLERGQRVQGMLRLIDGWGVVVVVVGIGNCFLTASSWWRDLATQRARPVKESAVVTRLLTSIELR
jgi:hypothetical protein